MHFLVLRRFLHPQMSNRVLDVARDHRIGFGAAGLELIGPSSCLTRRPPPLPKFVVHAAVVSPAPMGTGAGLEVVMLGTGPLGEAVRSREFNAAKAGRFPRR